MTSPERPRNHIDSSPRQLSTVLDRDEGTPSTARMVQSDDSRHSSQEDSSSSRSTVPFPSAPSDQSEANGGHENFASVIQALRNIARTSSPPASEESHTQTPPQATSPTRLVSSPQPATPTRFPRSPLLSPLGGRGRRTSSPLKPSLSHVDSLSSSRQEPRKRVSFDHATSGPTVSMQNLSSVLHMTTQPQSGPPSQVTRGHTSRSSPTKGIRTPRSGSRSRSQSPRRFWPLFRMPSNGEPWEAKDPYRLHLPIDNLRRRRDTMLKFWDQMLRQIYRHFLLRLPSVYFTRVSKVFEEAELSRVEVQKMIEASKRARNRRLRRGQRQAQSESHARRDPPPDSLDFWPNEREWMTPIVSPSLQRFKQSWDEFMESLQKEWKTLNVVSALLLSAILTMFQVDGSNEPVMRTAALIALVCALWSLTFGCMYILRFSTMKSMHKASRWAEEAQKHTTGIWWNVWVFLALPSVFLAWAVISFCVAIMAFSWTSGSVTPPAPISDSGAIGPRIGITAVFLLGFLYFIRVVRTLKKYADPLPRHWALHSPPPISPQDPSPTSEVPELDLERAEGIALGNVKAAADRAEAEEEAARSRKAGGRGLMPGFRYLGW